MSDTDPDSSTDSDNNNLSPFFNRYFRVYAYDYEPGVDVTVSPRIVTYQASTDDSSDSDVFPDLYHDSTSSAVSF